MPQGGRRVLFEPGHVRATERGASGIRVGPPPSSGGGGTGREGGIGGGTGGGRGRGRGQGGGLASLQQLVLALGAISSTAGKVVPSPPPVAASALVLLSTTTLSSSSTVDVSGIDQTYSDLIIAGIARGAAALGNVPLTLQINGDSGATYDYEQMFYSATSFQGGAGTLATSLRVCGAIPGSSATANRFGGFEIQILGYTSTAAHKTVICTYGFAQSDAAVGQFAGMNSGTWLSTAAVNRVTLFVDAVPQTLVAGTQVRIYGRK